MDKYYTNDRNAQIILALLKAHGIRKVVASPGATNIAMTGSCQHDPWFEMYSCVDERSAAYMACGLAAESGEPVVLTCTGATASRNYLPAMTEAHYRKLPILAVTSTVTVERTGHLTPQSLDRSVSPHDTFLRKIELPKIKDDEDAALAELRVNMAILELKRRGGGPVHINLQAGGNAFSVKELPTVRKIERITREDAFPPLPTDGRIAVYVCSHAPWTAAQTDALDRFCAANNAVVFCDHSSGYKGKYRLMYALVAGQDSYRSALCRPDLLIHIGELSGDYLTYGQMMSVKKVWRVSIDGEVRDTFKKLTHVFEMPEQTFFEYYAGTGARGNGDDSYLNACLEEHARFYKKIPEMPFSNDWIAYNVAPRIPENSVLHLGVSNTMRSWTFFDVPRSVATSANVGVRGIDGALSTLVGASFARPDVLHFGVLGDLTFFYDMNALGNRHIGNNLRVMLINNGRGTEFRLYIHAGQKLLGDDADPYVAAAGHFGNKSPTLVKHYAEDLGFEYLCASGKEEFLAAAERFLTPELTDKPMFFEVFTDYVDESAALKILKTIGGSAEGAMKDLARNILGPSGISFAKKILGK